MVQLNLIFLLAGLIVSLVLFLVHAHSVRNQHRQRDSAHTKLSMELEIHKAQLDANAQLAAEPSDEPAPAARVDDGHVHE